MAEGVFIVFSKFGGAVRPTCKREQVLPVQDVIDPRKIGVHGVSRSSGTHSWQLASCAKVVKGEIIRSKVLDTGIHTGEVGFLPGNTQKSRKSMDVRKGFVIRQVIFDRPKTFLSHAF